MKKIFNIILFALFCTSFAQAQGGKTFEFTYKGQTLQYEVANGNEAMVSKQQSAKISGDVKFPESVTFAGKKYTVTTIGIYAFFYCTGLTCITIPNSVTTIGDFAFARCAGLTSVSIPNSVTTIGNDAFVSCGNLKNINVSKGNSHYSSENGVLFDITKKTLIQCPKGIKGNYAIPNSVTTIGRSAFIFCTGLTSVTIPNSVTKIGGSAFSNCTGLTTITIPNSVEVIDPYAFSRCTGLTSVTIPNSVTAIEGAAFFGCTGLTSVTIPNSVTTIGQSAFYGCASLTSVTIPNSVTTIGDEAFKYCSSLTLLTIENATPPEVRGGAFDGVSENITIYVPAESVEKYKTAEGWSEYADKIKAIEK